MADEPQDDPWDLEVDALSALPHSTAAERAVLGGLMLAPNALERLGETLTAEDFYQDAHRLVFQAILACAARGQPFDVLALGEWMVAQGQAEQIAGGALLIDLVQDTPSAANIEAYARIVRDKAVLRQLVAVGTEIVRDGFTPAGRTTVEVIKAATQRVFEVSDRDTDATGTCSAVHALLHTAYEILKDRYDAQGRLTGLPSGYPELDELTAGWQPGDLIVLAARPSMGKTTLAVNMAEHVALHANKAVAIFTMEMASSQLAFRLIASVGRIDATHLRTGQLDDAEWAQVSATLRVLSGARIFMDDTPSLSPAELRARARRLQREHGIELVVIDYLQLMQVPGSREHRATTIAQITRSLKTLAKELQVPVIVLSQLNRAVETRIDKHPIMADLRESGGIEQDADVIVFVYRDEVYHPGKQENQGLAEIIIAKQRNGPVGTVELRFDGAHARFDNKH